MKDPLRSPSTSGILLLLFSCAPKYYIPIPSYTCNVLYKMAKPNLVAEKVSWPIEGPGSPHHAYVRRSTYRPMVLSSDLQNTPVHSMIMISCILRRCILCEASNPAHLAVVRPKDSELHITIFKLRHLSRQTRILCWTFTGGVV